MEHRSSDVVAEFLACHAAWRSRVKLMRDGVFVGGGARPNGRWEYADDGRVLVLSWFHWPKDILQQTTFGFANAKLKLEVAPIAGPSNSSNAGSSQTRSFTDLPATMAALRPNEYQIRAETARAAVNAAVQENSITFPWVEEFLVVGNSRIDRTEKHGFMIDAHPFVVRFGDGAIPERLAPEKEFLGEKTDLYCLNGWLFHPAAHLKGKRVMFTRPPMDRANLNHGLFVSEQKRDHIAKETSNYCHIPKRVFYDFFLDYEHTNPSSGLIFVYYVRQVLRKRVKMVNFRFERGLPSFHNNLRSPDSHNADREREILTAILNSPL